MIRVDGITTQDFPYTGLPIFYSNLTVYKEDILLTIEEDYNVQYYKNTDIGIGCVHIFGLQDYNFHIYKYFTIYSELEEKRIKRLTLISDPSLNDLTSVKMHEALIKQKKISDAISYINQTSDSNGFRASYFNETEEKLKETQEYLLRLHIPEQCITSSKEPPLQEMNGCMFWECEYE